MIDILFLTWRYLTFNWIKTVILVMSIALIVFLPVALNVLVGQSANELTARADATPLLVGAKGSPLELVLNSLYFESAVPALTTYAETHRIAEANLAVPIPLYVRFRVRAQPIVGTELDYFDFRNLRLAQGRRMAMLGECVLGAEAAAALGVTVGDTVVSSPESVFDLAGVYPLKMSVVGIFAPTFTADDVAVFVDLKTAWVIEGLVHGHQDLAAPEAAVGVLSRTGDTIVGNASVVQYNEITPQNVDSFHFHGDLSDYPITAVIAVPRTDKAATILMGRFESSDFADQITRPSAVMSDLLDTVLTIRGFVVGAILLVAGATAATAALVFLLSLRLRRREIETMIKIGGSRGHVAAIVVSEMISVLLLGASLAAVLTLLTQRFGAGVIRALLLG